MSIQQQIMDDLKQAMKKREQDRLAVLRSLKSRILEKEISERTGGKPADLTEEQVIEVLMKAAKQRKESIEQFRDGGRDDLVANEQKELDIIESYLPEMLSEEEIRDIARQQIEKTGADGMQDMGKVMGVLMKELKGQAEGGLVSKVVKEELSRT